MRLRKSRCACAAGRSINIRVIKKFYQEKFKMIFSQKGFLNFKIIKNKTQHPRLQLHVSAPHMATRWLRLVLGRGTCFRSLISLDSLFCHKSFHTQKFIIKSDKSTHMHIQIRDVAVVLDFTAIKAYKKIMRGTFILEWIDICLSVFHISDIVSKFEPDKS
jgi:hypothetical protein